jgi:hypothetical protein
VRIHRPTGDGQRARAIQRGLASGAIAEDLKTPWRNGMNRQEIAPLAFVQQQIEWPLCGSQTHCCYVSSGSRVADRTHRLHAEQQSSKSIRQTAAARRQRSRTIPARRGRRLTLPVRRCTNAASSLSGSRQRIAWRAVSRRPPTHRCARPWTSPAPQRAPRHVERFDRTARSIPTTSVSASR